MSLGVLHKGSGSGNLHRTSPTGRNTACTVRTCSAAVSGSASGTAVGPSSTGFCRRGLPRASYHRTRRRLRCWACSADRHPSGGSSARRTAGTVGGQFLSRARTTSHTISPTRKRNSTPIPSHPSEPIPFPKPPIMVNSSFIYPLRPGHVQCRARVPCSRRGTVAHRLPIACGHPLTGVSRFPTLAGGPADPATRETIACCRRV
jgi:hypothetical protein